MGHRRRVVLVAALLACSFARASAAAPEAHRTPEGLWYEDVCGRGAGFRCLAERLLPPGARPGDTILVQAEPPAGTSTPSDLLAAYSVPPKSAARGAVVAIVDLPDATALDDVNVYRRTFGIPELARCGPSGAAPCFAVVDENGHPDPVGLPDGGAADVETALEMDMISAVCPDCSILLVAITRPDAPTAADLLAAARAARAYGAVVTTICWAAQEAAGFPVGFTQPAEMLVVAASGDDGYGQPLYPASSPDVLAVGGTVLARASDGTYGESVWEGFLGATSSGCSALFARPAFQEAFHASHPAAFGACGMRATNDVSAAAAFVGPSGFGGIATYASAREGWSAVAGTSAAAPQIAALLARLGLAREASRDLGFVYRNAAAFDDVTSGSDDDGTCADRVLCDAARGWDGPTGVGTPNGERLAGVVVSGHLSSDAGSCRASGGAGRDAALAIVLALTALARARKRRASARSSSAPARRVRSWHAACTPEGKR